MKKGHQREAKAVTLTIKSHQVEVFKQLMEILFALLAKEVHPTLENMQRISAKLATRRQRSSRKTRMTSIRCIKTSTLPTMDLINQVEWAIVLRVRMTMTG